MYSEFFSRMVLLTPAPAMMGAAPSPYAPMVMGASLVPLVLMTRRPVLTEALSMVWVALVQVAPALSSRDSPALRVMPFAAVNELNGAGLASVSVGGRRAVDII